MDLELSVSQHLNELRKRVVVCLAALSAGSIISFPFASRVFKILRLPANGIIERFVYFSPSDAFLIYLRVSFFCGIFISMPVMLYQLWIFITPAIEERLKKNAGRFILFCVLSFVCGGFFAYFLLLPKALHFLLSIGKPDLEPLISADRYITFIISFILACGLVFQMPVISFILTKLGIINAGILRKKYKYALVFIFIAAAIITPTTDAFNLLILACPMLILYEISIWVSFFALK